MKFKPFDKNTSHHWATLMSWFQVILDYILLEYLISKSANVSFW